MTVSFHFFANSTFTDYPPITNYRQTELPTASLSKPQTKDQMCDNL
jgi:hypothetical protein